MNLFKQGRDFAMSNLEEVLKMLGDFELKELIKIKSAVDKSINLKSDKKRVIYKHKCFGSSDYHFNKYKHYSKVLTLIDNTKTNGYAFVGEFLPIQKESLVREGSYVVEVCDADIYLYKIKADSDELLLQGKYSEMVTFIKRAKEITGM